VPKLKLGENFFKQLSEFSKYGLGFVYGNDDVPGYIDYLKTDRVFFLDDEPVIIDDVAIIGLSDALDPSETRARDYPEEATMFRFESYRRKEERAYEHLTRVAERFSDNRIILVSHSPPYGVLDFSMRFGQTNVGMMGIRNFVTERENVIVNICGHSHLNGGKVAHLKKTLVINVASHDDNFSRGNVALITIDHENINVKWYYVPSVVEEMLVKYNEHPDYYAERLKRIFGSRGFPLILDHYINYGEKFLNSLPMLAKLYYSIRGATWCAVILLWDLGVRRLKDILLFQDKLEEVFEKLKRECRLSGIFEANLRSGIYRLISMQRNMIFIASEEIDMLTHPKRIIFDLEYIQRPEGAYKVILYGFLKDENVRQYLFNEEDAVIEFVLRSLEEGYYFYHYGGADRRYLLDLLASKTDLSTRDLKNRFINVHYIISKSIGLPIDSYSLLEVVKCLIDKIPKEDRPVCKNDVHSILKKHVDGFFKLIMMNTILHKLGKGWKVNEITEIEQLKEANEVDLILLDYLIEVLLYFSNKQKGQKRKRD